MHWKEWCSEALSPWSPYGKKKGSIRLRGQRALWRGPPHNKGVPISLLWPLRKGTWGKIYWDRSLLLPSNFLLMFPIGQTQPEALGRRTLCASEYCFVFQGTESMAMARGIRKGQMLSTVWLRASLLTSLRVSFHLSMRAAWHLPQGTMWGWNDITHTITWHLTHSRS